MYLGRFNASPALPGKPGFEGMPYLLNSWVLKNKVIELSLKKRVLSGACSGGLGKHPELLPGESARNEENGMDMAVWAVVVMLYR